MGKGSEHVGGGDRAGAALGDAANADLALALVFTGVAGHAHHVAQADRIGIAAFEDEDAV